MKKRILAIICAVLAFSILLCGCSKPATDKDKDAKDTTDKIESTTADGTTDKNDNNDTDTTTNPLDDPKPIPDDTTKPSDPPKGDGDTEDTKTPETDNKKDKDINTFYTKLTELGEMPILIALDEMFMSDFYGITEDLYTEAIVSCSETGIDADEIWIIKASSKANIAKIEDLANHALKNKRAATKDYLPEEYAIAMKGKVIIRGDYVFLLVSPYVDDMVKLVNSNF